MCWDSGIFGLGSGAAACIATGGGVISRGWRMGLPQLKPPRQDTFPMRHEACRFFLMRSDNGCYIPAIRNAEQPALEQEHAGFVLMTVAAPS